MSIIIKGMDMPKNCWMCPLSVLYEKPREMLRCKLTKEEVLRYKIDSNCPLIELPPHGRLIDADALVKQMHDNIQKTNNARYAWVDELDIALAPTIIESEEEEYGDMA